MTAADRTPRSKKLYDEACQLMPGGVNSPVRAFKGVGGTPIFMKRAEGAYYFDEDGHRYIEYINSWGPAIVGHAHPEVVKAVQAAVANGLSFGAPTAAESDLARKVMELMPAIECVRLVSSGTEACMSALRVARAYAGRDKIVKFTGCYHGHADMLLVKAGSGALTLGLPDSPGVPKDATAHTLTVPFNDIDALKELFHKNKGQVGALIMEPILGNSGMIRPEPGYLKAVIDLCREEGAVSIFDEVMTGFRVHPGGVQGLEGVKPDMTTLGKVIGGGMPIGAFGGRREIMDHVAPAGSVYQAGTLSGNPVAVACGLKTLEILSNSSAWDTLRQRTRTLASGLQELAGKHQIPLATDAEGGMFGFFFRAGPVRTHEDAREANMEQFKTFFHGMLAEGVYLAPSAYEAGFVSMAHSEADIEATLTAADKVMTTLK